MKTVLFLSNYENNEEFYAIFDKLKPNNINGIIARPIDLSVIMHESDISVFFKNEEIFVDLIIGYAFEEDLLPAMNLLNIFKISNIPVLNGSDTLFNGQNKTISSALLNMNKDITHYLTQ